MLYQNTSDQINSKIELFNIEAEQIILGTTIINNEYLSLVSSILSSEYFYEPINRKIYQHIKHIIEVNNTIANQVTLRHFFETEEDIRNIGGKKYLSLLLSKASIIVDIKNYANLIKDLFIKRNLITIGENIVNKAYKDTENTAIKQIENAEQKLFNLTFHQEGKGFLPTSSSIDEVMKKIDSSRKSDKKITGISTGLLDLDKELSGMQDSDLIIIAGRPSMGKTALAISIAMNACDYLTKEYSDQKPVVGFFSLEMSSEQLSTRLLSMHSGMDANSIRKGFISQDGWDIISSSARKISELPLFIDDNPALSINEIRNKTRRLKRKYNLSLLIVDYLQLIKGDFSNKTIDSRVQEISSITQGLKAIAKEFDIPVIALSQLSRAVEQRGTKPRDKRPQLSDLRESGSIEQDADVVIFIYREYYYLEREKPSGTSEEELNKIRTWEENNKSKKNLSELVIAKQRNGPIGTVQVFFDPELIRFSNLDYERKLEINSYK